MKVYICTAARADILRQYSYYLDEKGSPDLAERFLDSVQSAIAMLCSTPEMGVPRIAQISKLQGLRPWRVSGFPAMRIYYVHSENALRIVRVLHGKRDISPLLDEESTRDE